MPDQAPGTGPVGIGPTSIHPTFAKSFRALKNGHVNGLAHATTQGDSRSVLFFELLIGKQRICWEFEQGHGKCSIEGTEQTARVTESDASFPKRFGTLKNGHVNDLDCACVLRNDQSDTQEIRCLPASFLCFGLLIGKQRICWEVEQGFGRCFMMMEDDVDGAGVFPLSMGQAPQDTEEGDWPYGDGHVGCGF